MSWFLDRKIVPLKEAIEREREDQRKASKGTGLEFMPDVLFQELGNGESLILE